MEGGRASMPRRYHNYRGRSRGGSAVSILVALLILLAAIIILFFALQNSIVFSSSGIQFAGPFGSGTPQASPDPSPEHTPELIIVTDQPSQSPDPDETPSPSPSTATITIKAVYLPDLGDATAVAGVLQLADKGVINAVVVDMKHDDGTLAYVSTNTNAVAAGANPPTAVAAYSSTSDTTDTTHDNSAEASSDTSSDSSAGTTSVSASVASNPARVSSAAYNESLQKLRDSGLYMIARMSAFKDNLAPRKIQSMSVKTKNGVIWLDRDYHGWLNPYNAEAQSYLSSLASELAALGFDEILLDHFCFPTIGRPQLLYFGDQEQTPRTEALDAFAQKLAHELAAKNVLLSISVFAAPILNGPDAATGQDPAQLYTIADRIYFETGTDATAAQALYEKAAADAASSGRTDSMSDWLVPMIRSPRSYDDPSASENIQTAIGAFGQNGYGWLILDASGLYPSAGW